MSPSFVLDCSAAMTLCFQDEATASSDEFWSANRRSQVVVPTLWFVEVCNTLLVAERRKRISRRQAELCIDDLLALSLQVDRAMSGPLAAAELPPLAREHGLTIYDATYLELAMRESLPLCTLDRQLVRAARAAKVVVFNVSGASA